MTGRDSRAPLPPESAAGPDTDPPRPRRTGAEITLEALTTLPNLAKLCVRLLAEPDVPRRTKALLGLAGLYFLSPVDVIPERFFPVVGRVDDLLLLAYALHRLLDAVEPSVLQEHWDGDEDALELVKAFVAWSAELMPAPVQRLLER